MRCSLHHGGHAGFTPIEVLVASAVGFIALAAFASLNVNQMYTMCNQGSQVDLQGSARNIADLFAREVRRAGTLTNPSCSGTVSTGLTVAQSSTVRILANIDGTPGMTGSNEDVTYTLDFTNNEVKRTDNSIPRTDILWSGASINGVSAINGSTIKYFDSNGNQLDSGSALSAGNLLKVTRIELDLALTAKVVQPGNATQLTAKDSAVAELRNRYFVMNICPTPGVN